MHLNQYYTDELYSDRLVSSLSVKDPNLALDLGFGAGGLLHAAKRRWCNIGLVGIDVDTVNVATAKTDKLIHAIELNGFSSNLPEIIQNRFGKIDLLISNPPYFSKRIDEDCNKILRASGLVDCISKRARFVPAELIFLAQNLRLLTDDGEIGIILPAGLISGEKWVAFRSHLFSNYFVSNVIQLPVNSFRNTDAQTFILTISKRKIASKYKVRISHVSHNDFYDIDASDAVSRCDFLFFHTQNRINVARKLNASDFNILRGNKTHKELKQISENYIHTTNMPSFPTTKAISNNPLNKCVNARAGDIVISRVGSRCLGRVIFIEHGELPVSDCVIVIRPANKEVGTLIWKKISSDTAFEYLSNTSFGVGAKYITHKSIENFLLK
jgi:type I restriction enzyme M protein